MKRTFCSLAVAMTVAWVTGPAAAEMDHGARDLPETFTLVMTFTGLVDVLSDGTSTPETVWLALPDASDPASLELSEAIKGKYSSWLIAQHEARIFGASLDPSEQSKRCDSDTTEPSKSLRGYKFAIQGHFLEPTVTVDRAPRRWPVPCDPADASCPDTRPIRIQELSVEWLPRLDDVLPYDLDYRDGLLDDGAGVLSSIFVIKKGRIFSGALWKYDGEYSKVDFPDVPPNRWEQRATAKQVTVVMDVVGDRVTLLGTPFKGGDPVSIEIKGATGETVAILVENQPAGMEVDDFRVCDGEVNDFAAHYVLRQYSSILTGPLLSFLGGEPSDNPQCSPADNKYP